MLHQLNPPIPLETVDGRKCHALLVIDYSQEYEVLFLVAFSDNRELWCLPHTQLRAQENISLGRVKAN